MLVLGIETSCDETAAAIVKDGRKLIANKVYTQTLAHEKWGGVVPELASREHLLFINSIIEETLKEAKLELSNIDLIAVTQGPGLLGSLLVGINTAKTLAWIHQKDIIAVNHLHGHICANYLESNFEPPFLCLLASGGHTQIIKVDDYANYEILGESIDDACGEAFDKVAKLLDLPYPGGPELDKLAQSASDTFVSDLTRVEELPEKLPDARLETAKKRSLLEVNEHFEQECNEADGALQAIPKAKGILHGRYTFPIAQVGEFDFSFSGLKTAVLRLKQSISKELWQKDKAKIALAFQQTVSKTLLRKIKKASEKTGLQKIVIAGGVAANSTLRREFEKEFSKESGYALSKPELRFCTDNAAMIASAGYFKFQDQKRADELDFAPFSR